MSEKRYIDLPKAVELVLGNIAERTADYRYTEDPWTVEYRGKFGGAGCYNLMFDVVGVNDHGNNRTNHRKGCLVGSAFVDFGISIEEMVKKGVVGGGMRSAAEALGIELSHVANNYLQRVQSNQDDGFKWGEAHASALSRALRFDEDFTEAEMEWLGVRQDKESVAS